jgi:hypothetical protein
MPRYYFHYRNGDLFKDDIGQQLPGLEAARRHARQVALDLARGGEPKSASVVVAEEDRTVLVVQLFSETQPPG